MKKEPGVFHILFMVALFFVLGGVSKALFDTGNLALAIPVAIVLTCGCGYILADFMKRGRKR